MTSTSRTGGPPMSALVAFVELRTAVRAAPIGDGGPDTCEALTAALDDALVELAAAVDDQPVAVVALGGYGRREQCLSSDVDVMLLHDEADVEQLTRAILYPLWDANLKVGHAVRTVRQCATAAAESFETLTSLLSFRHVAGDDRLTKRLETEMAGVVKGRPLARTLAQLERDRRAAEPYPVMNADLKNGRGGLRTFQGAWWERRRAFLLGLHIDPETPEEAEAWSDLLAIRNALHATAGRAHERFHPDLRDGAAAWLGTDTFDVASRLCRALRVGDHLAESRWSLHPGSDPLVGFGRRVFRRVRSRFGSGPDVPVAPSPPLAAALQAASRPEGVRLETAERELIASAPPADWTDADRAALVTLLTGGERGRAAFDLLEDLGWTDGWFPEWRVVSGLPQLAPFHEHPVGAHLWRTVDEIQRLPHDAEPVTSGVASAFGSDEELLLAAFLHDIGKGHGGDHSEIGEGLATAILRRTGFGPSVVATVATAVKHHLLLSKTAMRSDIADPAVIDEVVDAVGDQYTLELLYLLTVADARATGPTMWTPLKETLVRQLYFAVSERLGGSRAPSSPEALGTVVEAAAGAHPERTVAEHVAAMPADYLQSTSAADVVWHLDAVAAHTGSASVSTSPDDPLRVVVVGGDRHGFMLAVARVFAANGVAVVDARLLTRSDGTAIDTFRVHSDRSAEAITAAVWLRVAADLRAVLDDDLDIRKRVRTRVATYAAGTGGTVAVRPLPAGSARHTIVEVRAPDRVGLLADIVEALHNEGLDLHMARLDTRATEAIDVFHVRRLGVPIRLEPELQAMCRRIADRISSRPAG